VRGRSVTVAPPAVRGEDPLDGLRPHQGVFRHDDRDAAKPREHIQAAPRRVSGAARGDLQRDLRSIADPLADRVRLVPHHHHGAPRLERDGAVQHVRQHRAPPDLVEHLRQPGLHPLPLTRRQDHDGRAPARRSAPPRHRRPFWAAGAGPSTPAGVYIPPEMIIFIPSSTLIESGMISLSGTKRK
jgi:hypothetical protein